jgi:hypothetical protein
LYGSFVVLVWLKLGSMSSIRDGAIVNAGREEEVWAITKYHLVCRGCGYCGRKIWILDPYKLLAVPNTAILVSRLFGIISPHSTQSPRRVFGKAEGACALCKRCESRLQTVAPVCSYHTMVG